MCISVGNKGRANDLLAVVLVLVAKALVLLFLILVLLLFLFLLLLLLLLDTLLVVSHLLVVMSGVDLLFFLLSCVTCILYQLVAKLGHPVFELPLPKLQCLQLHLLSLCLGEA